MLFVLFSAFPDKATIKLLLQHTSITIPGACGIPYKHDSDKVNELYTRKDLYIPDQEEQERYHDLHPKRS